MRRLTRSIGFFSNSVNNLWSATKVETQHRVTMAMFQHIGDVERPLTELVVGGADELSAEFNGCESVQSIEDQPGRLGVSPPGRVRSGLD